MKNFGKFSIAVLIFIFLSVFFKPINVLASATLTLQNVVVNDNGGTAVATDGWTLHTYFGPTNISGVTGSSSVTNAIIDAGTYGLFEFGGPSGYTSSDWSCTNGVTVLGGGNTITVGNGQSTVCTITNNDYSPILHLRNVVVNDNGGTAIATDWTLSATGTLASPTNLSGSTPVDSNSNFKADTYLLHASGPANYTDSSWNCVPEPDPDSSITLQLGENITCTITHDDILPVVAQGGGPLVVFSSPTINTVTETETTPLKLSTNSVVAVSTSIPVTSTVVPIPKWPKTGFISTFFDKLFNFKSANQNNLEASTVEATVFTDKSEENKVPSPIRLKIPKINVNTNIEVVGIASDGALDVPKNFTDVAWFNLGPRPGENGNAVIDGHSGRKNNASAVFDNLYKLKKGDKIYTEDEKGTDVVFFSA